MAYGGYRVWGMGPGIPRYRAQEGGKGGSKGGVSVGACYPCPFHFIYFSLFYSFFSFFFKFSLLPIKGCVTIPIFISARTGWELELPI